MRPTTAAALGLAYALDGRVAAALPVLAEGGPDAPPARTLDTSTPKTTLGAGYLEAGRLDEAAAIAARAAELAAERGYRGSQARAAHLLGGISARRDPPDVEPADAHYRRALELADELGMRPLVAHCHLGLGELYLRAGRRAEAAEHLATAAALYRAMDMPFWLAKADAARAAPS